MRLWEHAQPTVRTAYGVAVAVAGGAARNLQRRPVARSAPTGALPRGEVVTGEPATPPKVGPVVAPKLGVAAVDNSPQVRASATSLAQTVPRSKVVTRHRRRSSRFPVARVSLRLLAMPPRLRAAYAFQQMVVLV